MQKSKTNRSARKVGMPPGTLLYTGEKKIDTVEMGCWIYSLNDCTYRDIQTVQELEEREETNSLTWLNINGLHDTELLETVGNLYGLDALILEDIISTQQRPKVEIFDEHTLIICRMLRINDMQLVSEQLSIILMADTIITFQEQRGDVFDPVRKRLKTAGSRLRKFKTDYLAYALLDVVIDNYFVVLEKIGDENEDMENEVLNNASPELLERIYFQRRKLTNIRRAVWPLREAVASLRRDEIPLIKKTTHRFLADLSDHVAQTIDIIETSREMVGSILDIYLSMLSHRMNEVMKVLTIIATIFIPLSFLAGVYGMNFDTSVSPLNLPELGSPYGYPTFWIICLFTAGALLLFFRRRKWL